jgi:hypothetical protein
MLAAAPSFPFSLPERSAFVTVEPPTTEATTEIRSLASPTATVAEGLTGRVGRQRLRVEDEVGRARLIGGVPGASSTDGLEGEDGWLGRKRGVEGEGDKYSPSASAGGSAGATGASSEVEWESTAEDADEAFGVGGVSETTSSTAGLASTMPEFIAGRAGVESFVTAVAARDAVMGSSVEEGSGELGEDSDEGLVIEETAVAFSPGVGLVAESVSAVASEPLAEPSLRSTAGERDRCLLVGDAAFASFESESKTLVSDPILVDATHQSPALPGLCMYAVRDNHLMTHL